MSGYSPEECKLREITGGDYFSEEFMNKLKSLNLTVKEANIVLSKIRTEITTGECCLEAIPIRLNYLLKQMAPKVKKQKIDSRELLAKKELVFLLNQENNRTICPNCQSQLFITDKFCYRCGSKNNQIITVNQKNNDDDLNLDEIYCAKLYEKYPLGFKYAYVCFLKYLEKHPGEIGLPVFNDIDGFTLKKQAIKDNYIILGDPVYSIVNYNVSDIKKVLKKYKLKVSGKKEELIKRISENLSPDEINKEFENNTFVLTQDANKFLKENEYLIYYKNNNLSELISLDKYESLFKKAKVTDSIYDVLIRYYTNLANEFIDNKIWIQYKEIIGHIIAISPGNISDLKLLKLHFQYFILEANNWIKNDYNDYKHAIFNPNLNKTRNELIANLKLELDELQEIFDESWDDVKIPYYCVSKKDTFKKLILAFNGEDLNIIH